MAVHTRMPDITAIKSGMIFFGLYGEGAIGVRYAGFVRKFPLHASEGQVGEVFGSCEGQLIDAGFRFKLGVGLRGRVLRGGLRGRLPCIKEQTQNDKSEFAASFIHSS